MAAANDNLPLTADVLRQELHYDPATGIFTRAVARGRHKVGDVAGSAHNYPSGPSGYIQIGVRGRLYLAHRLAWLWMTGEWPKVDIDHRNGRKNDNRFQNLREATKEENMQNMRRARKDSTSGLLGTSPDKSGRWQSKISVKGKTIYIGTFDTAEQAHAAYIDAKRKLHSAGTL